MMQEKINKVKQHLRDNRTAYIAGGVCLTVGAVGGVMFSKGGVQIVDSFKLINWRSPHTSQTILIRRGHPGNIIRCNETGELFASQERAALMNKVNPSQLAGHLRGKHAHVKGLTFTKLGEAQAPDLAA